MYTRYTTTVRNNVCCKFILEYNQKVLYLFIKDDETVKLCAEGG